jgi:hypothetical protein
MILGVRSFSPRYFTSEHLSAAFSFERGRMRSSSLFFVTFAIVAAATVTLVAINPAHAQGSLSDELNILLTTADHDAARAASTRYRHGPSANDSARQKLHARQDAEQAGAQTQSGGWQ